MHYPPIAYYVSAHGYGHGVRSCDIIRTFNRLYPRIPVIIVSDLPETFLRNRLPKGLNLYRGRSFDVGMLQRDSVKVDVQATLERLQSLSAAYPSMLEQECTFLGEQGVRVVVSDIPSLPLDAAAKLRIPAVAVGNFAWDWIYSAFADQDKAWDGVARMFAKGYAKSDLLLRLPFSEPMAAFPRKEDIPLVAEPGQSQRDALAGITGADPGKKWILLSFSTLDWDESALRRIDELRDYEFITVRPLEWPGTRIRSVDREHVPFSAVLATVDVVLTKPGFGVLSECVVNRKPMIYVDRTDFAEYPILETAVKRYLKHVHLPADDLYRGDIGRALDAIWDQPEPLETQPAGGGPIAAQRIAEFYHRY